MGRKYRNPPLIEAVCEFQFTDTKWNATIPGIFYQKVENDFPIIEEKNFVEVNVDAGVVPGDDSGLHGTVSPRVLFYSEDRTRLIQIGPGVLVVNVLEPYSDWESFAQMIFETLDKYVSVKRTSSLKRIGVRYINRIHQGDDERLKDILNYYPHLPSTAVEDPKSLLVRTELDFASLNGRLIFTLATVAFRTTGEQALALDLDFITLDASKIEIDDIDAWIQSAHDQIEVMFEASITERLRQRFEPED